MHGKGSQNIYMNLSNCINVHGDLFEFCRPISHLKYVRSLKNVLKDTEQN